MDQIFLKDFDRSNIIYSIFCLFYSKKWDFNALSILARLLLYMTFSLHKPLSIKSVVVLSICCRKKTKKDACDTKAFLMQTDSSSYYDYWTTYYEYILWSSKELWVVHIIKRKPGTMVSLLRDEATTSVRRSYTTRVMLGGKRGLIITVSILFLSFFSSNVNFVTSQTVYTCPGVADNPVVIPAPSSGKHFL